MAEGRSSRSGTVKPPHLSNQSMRRPRLYIMRGLVGGMREYIYRSQSLVKKILERWTQTQDGGEREEEGKKEEEKRNPFQLKKKRGSESNAGKKKQRKYKK